MLPGPVLGFELLTTARRGRFYVLRVAYALLILLILWERQQSWYAVSGEAISVQEASEFAYRMFYAIAIIQLLALILLTPALTAGLIADEKQRKTLHYLMASPLGGAEIVLGKLLARLLHIGVLLGVGMPILSLLTLLGGVDPRLILLACALSLSTAYFLGALSVLVSTYARRVREALFVAYTLMFAWLIVPLFIQRALLRIGGVLYDWLGPVNEWVYATSPVAVVMDLVRPVAMGMRVPVIDKVVWMAGLQAAYGTAFVILAAWRLRPVFRAQDGTTRRWFAHLASRSWRLWPRPGCGLAPMVWKELYTTPTSGPVKIVGLAAAWLLGGFLAYHTYEYARPAFVEAWTFGSADFLNYSRNANRWAFCMYLKWAIPLLCFAWIVLVAGVAGGGVTSEHEGDTWTSLTATDLTAREILLAKMLGAVRGVGAIACAILALGLLGTAAGCILPVGLLALVISLTVYTWFAVALGTLISVAMKSSWRAQFLSVALLLLINFSGQSVFNILAYLAPPLWPGFMPVDVSRLLYAPGELPALKDVHWPRTFDPYSLNDGPYGRTVLGVLSLLAYASGAALLTWAALWRFEVAAGRPRRGRHSVGTHRHDLREPKYAVEAERPEPLGVEANAT